MNMSPNDFPKSVLKWINQREEPVLVMLVPHPLATMVVTEDDPEIITELYKAYMQILSATRKRIKEI
jgi:hypothetical protein